MENQIKNSRSEKMTTCISLLRGINVSGKNLIKMEASQRMHSTRKVRTKNKTTNSK